MAEEHRSRTYPGLLAALPGFEIRTHHRIRRSSFILKLYFIALRHNAQPLSTFNYDIGFFYRSND